MNKNSSVNIRNRKAQFDYSFVRELNVGIQLVGTEVKSIREGKVSLVDCYCQFVNGELFVKNMSIQPWNTNYNHEITRDRRLLLHKSELAKLERDLMPGMTIVVERMYSNSSNLIKLNIALARGKNYYDKRQSIKERETNKALREL